MYISITLEIVGANKKIRYDASENCIEMNDRTKKIFEAKYNIDQNDREFLDLICLKSVFNRYKNWIKQNKSIIGDFAKITKDFKKIDVTKFDFNKSEDKKIIKLYNKIKKRDILSVVVISKSAYKRRKKQYL